MHKSELSPPRRSAKRGQPFWIAGALLGGALLVYLGLAMGAWLFVRYRSGFPGASFSDFATLPLRWDSYRQKRGHWEVQRGLGLFREGKIRESILPLRTGLARVPTDTDSRLALARALAIGHRPDLTESILLTGLTYAGEDPRYLREVLEFLFSQQEDEKALALCQRELGAKPHLPAQAASVLQLGAATACFFRGHFDASEDWLNQTHLEDSATRLLRVQIQWERGYRELALTLLASLVTEEPSMSDAYDLLVRYLSAQGQFSDVRRFSVMERVANPQRVRPRLDYLLACERLGELNRAPLETQTVLDDFASDSAASGVLADYAAHEGNVSLARLLVQRRELLQLDSTAAHFALAEALSRAHHYKEARTELQSLAAQRTLSQGQSALLSGLQAVVAAGIGDAGSVQLHLTAFLGNPIARAENIVAVAIRLKEQGATDYARVALEKATRMDPLNQPALMQLIELDVEQWNLSALPTNIRRYLLTRKPSPNLLAAAQKELEGDAFLFSQDRSQTLELLVSALRQLAGTPR